MPYRYGNTLSPDEQRDVLDAFGYRWTVENQRRATSWYRTGGHKPPTMPPISDADWLRCTAFRVTKSGRLDRRARFCQSHLTPAGVPIFPPAATRKEA